MHVFKYILIALVICSLNNCSAFKKRISKPVTVAFTEPGSGASLSSSAFNTKYISLVNSAEIEKTFLESFRTEGSCTENITLSSSEENSDFILKLVSLSVSESSSTEKISDSKSEFNGQDIILNTVVCSAEFELVNTKNKTKTSFRCRNSKSRSEKVKNNRNIADLIFGTNKDRSNYRTKLLSDNICTHLAQDVGRRIWTPITRKIAKNL